MSNLAIFGDSHAFVPDLTNKKLAWPSRLFEIYNGHNYSHWGTSIWYSFDLFLKNYHQYSNIVFVYTSAHRIHVLPPHLRKWAFMSTSQPFNKFMDKRDLEEMKKVWAAQKYTANIKFDQFVYQKIFDDVNDICQKNNINLVNILPYENAGLEELCGPLDLSKMTGSCVTGIRYVSDNEKLAPDPNIIDARLCHLSDENNKVLFDIINDLLLSKEKCILHAKEIDKFVN